MADYSNLGLDPSWAVPYTPGNATAPGWGGSTASQPAWWNNPVGTESMSPGTDAFGDKLTKALGTLGQSRLANQPSEGGGGGGGSYASASSPTGSGRGPSLDALVQMLRKQYEALYPGGGGGGGKGLLGV